MSHKIDRFLLHTSLLCVTCIYLSAVSKLYGETTDSQVETSTPGEYSKVLAPLFEEWKRQRELPRTCHIVAHKVSGPTRPLTENEFRAILESSDLLNHPDRLAEITDKVLRQLQKGEIRESKYTEIELWENGPSVRIQRNSGASVQIRCRNPVTSIEYTSFAKQVTVMPIEKDVGRAIDSYRLMRWVPYAFDLDHDLSVSQSLGRLSIHLAKHRTKYVIDPSTQMVIVQDTSSEDGDLLAHIWQEGLFTTESGVVCPRVFGIAEFSADHKLSDINIVLLKSAEFNVELPDSLFSVVSVPPETVIVDFRDRDNKKPKAFRTLSETTDVVEAASQHPVRNRPEPRSGEWGKWLIIVNVLIFCLFLVAFLVKRLYSDRTDTVQSQG